MALGEGSDTEQWLWWKAMTLLHGFGGRQCHYFMALGEGNATEQWLWGKAMPLNNGFGGRQ